MLIYFIVDRFLRGKAKVRVLESQVRGVRVRVRVKVRDECFSFDNISLSDWGG